MTNHRVFGYLHIQHMYLVGERIGDRWMDGWRHTVNNNMSQQQLIDHKLWCANAHGGRVRQQRGGWLLWSAVESGLFRGG